MTDEIYPIAAGSPQTVLSEAYTFGDSSFVVYDSAKLLDAPNITTIVSPTGEFITVGYTDITGSVVSGITFKDGYLSNRFPIGSVVYRSWSKYDHDAFSDHISDLEDDKVDKAFGVANSVIITDGSGVISSSVIKTAFNSDIATESPLMDGIADVGDSLKLAKEDHVHPTDTTRAPLDVATISTDGLMSSEDKVILDEHVANVTTNPHNVTKTNVGLGNCDNTSDADKPLSTAQQSAIGALAADITANYNAIATLDDDLEEHQLDTDNPHQTTLEQLGAAPLDHADRHKGGGADQIALATTTVHGLMPSTDKSKLDGVAEGSQVNVLEGIQIDGVDLTITSKKSNIPLATPLLDGAMSSEDKTSFDAHLIDITNPHEVTKDQVGLSNVDNTSDANKPVSTAQATAIGLKVDIAQGIGNASKVVVTDASGDITTLATKTGFNLDVATAVPVMDGVAAVGVSAKLAKEDHVHPTDTTKVVIAQGIGNANKIVVTNPTTGNIETLTKKTAFNSDIATEIPRVSFGYGYVGTSTKLAREDHVHPSETSPIIGVQWDTYSTSSTLTWIDATGATITGLNTAWFDKHILFGGRWRCVRNRTTGKYTFGTNARGDGLTLDGTAGDVTVREPVAYVKADYGVAGTGIARYWVSPRPAAGFVVHPFWMQRNNGIMSPSVYSGAYESYGYLDGSTFKLGSASGKQPITGAVAYPNLPNSGRFNISDAETYANNITGTIRSGIENIWNYSASQLLMYIEFGTFNLQTALGKGIVDLESGTDFAGKLTGADDIDSRLAENGTGVGSGVDGQTPICWRGKENPWGNCYKFNIGANFYLDGSVILLKRDGTGTPAATLAAGSYDTVTGPVALTNGYISATLQDGVSNIAFLPASVAGGGSAYYLCDYYTTVSANGNILRAGGSWYSGVGAGPGCSYAMNPPSWSNRDVSARLEFYPEGGEV